MNHSRHDIGGTLSRISISLPAVLVIALVGGCSTLPDEKELQSNPSPSSQPDAGKISGTWKLTMISSGAQFHETLHIVQVGNVIAGHTESGEGISKIHGSIASSNISFKTGVDADGWPNAKEIQTEFNGLVRDDEMQGFATLGVFGKVTWKATRISR